MENQENESRLQQFAAILLLDHLKRQNLQMHQNHAESSTSSPNQDRNNYDPKELTKLLQQTSVFMISRKMLAIEFVWLQHEQNPT